MGDLARALHQLHSIEPRKIIIDDKCIIAVIARKFFQSAITIEAELDRPLFTGEHLPGNFGYLGIVLDLQNGNLRGGSLRSMLYDLPFHFSGPGEKVLSSLPPRGSGLEQFF